MNKIKFAELGDGSPLKNTRVAVIDADSMAFIIAWNHKERDDVEAVIEHTDDFIHSVLQTVQSRYYIGLLAPKESVANFRNNIAITQPYKGSRSEKPEWHQKWAPIIENRMIEHWGFYRVAGNLEADDVVVSLQFRLNQIDTCTAVLCGNDKDILQSPGHHYDFRKNAGCFIDKKQGNYNLFYQVLMGDKTDNIPGLSGCGKIGAAAVLDNKDLDTETYPLGVLLAFISKLGVDKGIKSFYENYMLCKLLTDVNLNHLELTPYDLDGNAVRQASSGHVTEVGEFDQLDVSGLFTIE